MNIQNLLNSIQKNTLSHSNYILFGEEEFFIDKIETAFLNHLIPEDEKSFNQKVFYGKETNVYSLITILKLKHNLYTSICVLYKRNVYYKHSIQN